MVIVSSSFASKSMFTNQMITYSAKSMLNPVSGNGFHYTGQCKGGVVCNVSVDGTGGGNNVQLTALELESLHIIEQLYTSNLSSKNYVAIPTDFTAYLRLFDVVYRAQSKYAANPALALLFQITTEALTGAMNAFELNALNVELAVNNSYLQGVIDELLSGINRKKVLGENTGNISMRQTFELAPLFKYYIKIYGMPAPGAGFDPVKLNLVLTALENSGIAPYS
jgi:hypothetical protein